ncbi:hypothetical protein ABKN59_009841 [Abortiporus biennis]
MDLHFNYEEGIPTGSGYAFSSGWDGLGITPSSIVRCYQGRTYTSSPSDYPAWHQHLTVFQTRTETNFCPNSGVLGLTGGHQAASDSGLHSSTSAMRPDPRTLLQEKHSASHESPAHAASGKFFWSCPLTPGVGRCYKKSIVPHMRALLMRHLGNSSGVVPPASYTRIYVLCSVGCRKVSTSVVLIGNSSVLTTKHVPMF